MTTSTKRLQGFAVMDPQRQREIASLGGRTAHSEGRAHRWSSEEAREAGRRGGLARKAKHDARKKEAA